MSLKTALSGIFNKKDKESSETEIKTSEESKATSGNPKKILMVIAPDNFRDEEFFEPKEIFENEGYEVTVSSVRKVMAAGMLGGKQKVDIVVSNASAADYDGLSISGGGGSRTYLWNNKDLHKLVNDFADAGKPIGAICISPVVLAKAGVLKGKKSTVFDDNESVGILKECGSDVSAGKKVVCDGNIVTANGPKASKAYGEKLVELLKK